MPNRVAAAFRAATLILCVCSCSAPISPSFEPPRAAALIPAAHADCSPRNASASSTLSSYNVAFSNKLTLGTHSEARIQIKGSFKKRGRDKAALKYPLHVRLDDPLGRVHLSCTTVWNLQATPSIISDGRGDVFSIKISYQSFSRTFPYWTTLPKDVPFSTGSAYVAAAWLRFGSDGNLWGPIPYTVRPLAVVRVSPTGRATVFTDPVAPNSATIDQMVLGSDGNMWIPYYDSYGGPTGMDRIAPDGTFTGFTLPGSDVYSGIVAVTAGHQGDLILGLQRPSGGAIGSFKMNGALQILATTSQPPTNIVWDKNGDLWFSLETIDTRNTSKITIGELRPGGDVKTYKLCCFNKFSTPFSFTLAPDGDFWAPYPYGKAELLKFDTQGRVVSHTPAPYVTPWYLAQPAAPKIVDYAMDRDGNVFGADAGNFASEFGGSGVIRITPDGRMREYPTYEIGADEPTSITYDAKTNKLYAANTFYVPKRFIGGSLVVMDPSQW